MEAYGRAWKFSKYVLVISKNISPNYINNVLWANQRISGPGPHTGKDDSWAENSGGKEPDNPPTNLLAVFFEFEYR